MGQHSNMQELFLSLTMSPCGADTVCGALQKAKDAQYVCSGQYLIDQAPEQDDDDSLLVNANGGKRPETNAAGLPGNLQPYMVRAALGTPNCSMLCNQQLPFQRACLLQSPSRFALLFLPVPTACENLGLHVLRPGGTFHDRGHLRCLVILECEIVIHQIRSVNGTVSVTAV